MFLRRTATIAFAAVACASISLAPTFAKSTKLRYGLAAYSFPSAVMFVAEDGGFFEKEGLDVTSELMSGSSGEAAATIAGNLPFYDGLSQTAALAIAKGQKLETFAELSQQFPEDIVVSKQVAQRLHLSRNMPVDQRLDALKGLRIADWVPGGSPDMLMHFIMAKKGWTARDITLLPIGPAAPMIATLQNNRVDGFVFSSPSSDEAVRRLGAFILYRGARPAWAPLQNEPFNCLIANASWLAAHKPEAVAIYRGLALAMDYMRRHPQAAKAIVRKRLKAFSNADFEAGYENLSYMVPQSPQVGSTQANLIHAFVTTIDPGFNVPADQLTDPEISAMAAASSSGH